MPDPRGKPTDLSNINQGDDSNHGLNSSLNNFTPSDFQVPGGGNNSTMDSHNNGDHDFSGRFNPMGGLPQVPTHQPGEPSFTRQTGPLMGGKHVDDDDEGFQTGDAANGPTFNKTDSRFSELDHNVAAPKLGQRRDDEPDGDSFGIDPSQDVLPNTLEPVLKDKVMEASDPTAFDSMKERSTIQRCFKLKYPQPLHLSDPGSLASGLEKIGLKYLVMSGVTCLYLGNAGYSTLVFVIASATGALAFYMLSLKVLTSLEWQVEKIMGSQVLAREVDGESMEWFNSITGKIWRCIDPRTFAVIEDILEDTLSRVVPSFIKAVRVSDFDVGMRPPRIEKIHIFPPTANQPVDSIFGEAEFSLRANASNTRTTSDKLHSTTPPGVSIRFKTKLNAAIDIRGELTKLTGKVRFKIVTSPEPPFVSKLTISFVRAPLVETAVMPITKKLNIMRLPMLKALVNEGVKLGFKSLVDPNSITIDIDPILAGVKADTDSIGVIKVEVRQAKRSSPSITDSQTSFVTLSLSDYQKNDIKTTRVLNNKVNPIWNETLYQLVTAEDITNDVYLNIKVWGADKVKSDSLWGSISASIKDVVLGKLDEYDNVSSWCTEERLMFDGWAPVDGKTEEEAQIFLDFKLSFHPKYVLPKPSFKDNAMAQKEEKKKAIKKEEKKEQKKKEKKKEKKKSMKEKKLLKANLKQKRKEEKKIKPGFLFNNNDKQISGDEKEDSTKPSETSENSAINQKPNLENGGVVMLSDDDADLGRTELIPCNDVDEIISELEDNSEDSSDEEEDITRRLPPYHISGILSLTVVQGVDLEILDPEVISFKKRRHPYKSNKAVSPYAVVYIDDTKVFRTRSKMRTANPNWNAATECFIKTYDTSYIRVSVKSNMDQEENPVIGTAVLKICDLFDDKDSLSKEAERWISLFNGIGYGKVLLQLKYKPVKLIIPKELRGADVGTLIIDRVEFTDIKGSLSTDKLSSTKATLSINVEPVIKKHLKSNTLEQNNSVWGWSQSNIYLPLMMRYRSALYIQISQGSFGSKATACLWMKELYDNDWQEVSMALCEYTNKEATDELSWGTQGPLGSIKLRLKFVPGFSPVHTELPEFTADMLGANPFQADDTFDKAHLLVRQEGTENYAIDTTSLKRRNSRQQFMEQVAARRLSIGSTESSDDVSIDTDDVEGSSSDKLDEDQPLPLTKLKSNLAPQKDAENNTVSFVDNNDSAISDKRRKSSTVTFDPSSKRFSSASSTGNTLFDSDNGRQSYASSSTSATLETEEDRRVSDPKPAVANNDGDKLNEIMEIDTVEYLEERQDDLKNSKIHKFKVLRKLSKGKDFFTSKVKSLTRGHNTQSQANKAVVNEV